MNGKTQHSRLGIASCVIGAGTWAYFILMLIAFFYTDLLKPLNSLGRPRSGQIAGGFEGMLEVLLVMIFLYVVVPFAGFALGSILAVVGCIQQKRKRLFAVIGLPISILYFVFVAIVFLGASVTG